MKRHLFMALVSIVVSGCAALDEVADISLKSTCNATIETVDDFLNDNPDIDQRFKDAIIESRVMNGMTKNMVAASWGSRADKIVITGHTTWQWEQREPKGEWVSFSDSKVVDASTYHVMYFSNYKRCTQ